MQRILTLLVLGVAAWLAGTTAHAEVVDFQISADDYAKLTIDGDQVALVDTLPGGTDDVSLDLAPGLHDIVVEYENRFGSSWLSLSWKDPADASYTIIPEANLFSQDAAGNVINGLLAEYSPDLTIYGEGPIAHSHRNFYEGISGVPWGGFVSTWTLFGETLTGQLLVVPEPNTPIMLLGVSASVLVGGVWRRQNRTV